MQKKTTLLGGALILAAAASAQIYTPEYIKWPTSSEFPTYVQQWKAGTLNMEDENFFIGRVKPHKTFRNVETQVNPAITESNDKRLIFWVPVGDQLNGVNTNALPNGLFNSEVFSMWSYVDVYGNWTSPHGWVPGAFSDIAHKNGVSVSGVASIAWGGISTEWNNALTAQGNLDNEDVARFLWAHGVDGLGYNSEFNGASTAVKKIASQHGKIVEFLESKGITTAENIWYDGTNYNGVITFDQGLGSHNSSIFALSKKRRASLFFNYNTIRYGRLASSVTEAEKLGVSPLYLYAGFNMQGNDPGTNNWVPLSQHPISIGLWGAHNNNMLWLNKNKNGSTAEAMQATYQKSIEQYFGNGVQNPAILIPVANGTCSAPTDNYWGMSSMKSAKSALYWDLSEEPFITYFNLGNGKFFNWMGERQNERPWYSFGVQDYLPTWRWWWAKELRGRDVKKGDVNMNATFTWDDAYVGGSCMRITGSDKDAYLHLFKTKFTLNTGDNITFTYKHNGGSANVTLVLAIEGAETQAVRESDFVMISLDDEADDEQWQTKTISLTGARGSQFRGKTLALVGLHIQDAKDLDMNLGQLAITRGTTATPATPEVTLARVIKTHYNGVDGKLIFNMPNDKPADEPCYNLDVNASMFKTYVQEEGGEPIFMGLTTSWAAMFYSSPVDIDSDARIRFGVAAVSVDHKSDSEIAWSEWLTKSNYETNNDITINKTMIKPNESFAIKYVDPRHAASTWTILGPDGSTIAEATNATGITVENGIDKIGGYDLVLDKGTNNERRFGYYVQITTEAVGALPEIYTTSINENEVTPESEPVKLELEQTADLSYTARPADGSASRGVSLPEQAFGVKVSELGLQNMQSFSVAGWIRLDQLAGEAYDDMNAFMTIENRSGNWPRNNWGFFWSRINPYGKFDVNKIDTGWGMCTEDSTDGIRLWSQYSDTQLPIGNWVHFAVVFEFNGSSVRNYFYVNGVLQTITAWLHVNKATYEKYCHSVWNDLLNYNEAGVLTRGDHTGMTDFVNYRYKLDGNDWISMGGNSSAANVNAMSFVLDDFQVWDKAMTQEDVTRSMQGFSTGSLPEGLLALWDFEDDPVADNSGSPAFRSRGSKPNVPAYCYTFGKTASEGSDTKHVENPAYSSGCPFLAGSAYQVVTLPTWTARKARVTNATGNSTAGQATVAYTKAGDYSVTLTLSNSHGSDSRTFPVFTVGDKEDGIVDVEAVAKAEAYGVEGAILVDFAAEGNYRVSVYNVSGTSIAARDHAAQAGDRMRVELGAPGVYVVVITKDGVPARAIKLMVK